VAIEELKLMAIEELKLVAIEELKLMAIEELKLVAIEELKLVAIENRKIARLAPICCSLLNAPRLAFDLDPTSYDHASLFREDCWFAFCSDGIALRWR
jgi:hypothetical protein